MIYSFVSGNMAHRNYTHKRTSKPTRNTDRNNKAFIDIRLRPGVATPLVVIG